MEKFENNSFELIKPNEEKIKIEESIKNFDNAILDNDLKQAEKILHEEIGDKKGEKWLEAKQRELQNHYYEKKDYEGVIRIIEKTKDLYSQKGRIQKYESITGKKYEGKKIEKNKNIEKPTVVNDSKSFRDAINIGEFEMAQEWIDGIKKNGYKGLPIEEVNKIIEHREAELKKEMANIENNE